MEDQDVLDITMHVYKTHTAIAKACAKLIGHDVAISSIYRVLKHKVSGSRFKIWVYLFKQLPLVKRYIRDAETLRKKLGIKPIKGGVIAKELDVKFQLSADFRPKRKSPPKKKS